MALVYSVVARGQSVLAEWSDSSGNFTTVTRMLLVRIENPHNVRRQRTKMVSYMYDGRYVFHSLEPNIEVNLRFLVMAEKSAGIKMPYKFLLHLRDGFIAKYGLDEPNQAAALQYTESFAPTMKDLLIKFNNCIKTGVDEPSSHFPELMKVREQVDAIQNVMIENIDEILARTDKIEILVNRAESIMENTYEFRRQAQQYQQMMWWRQKKLVIGVFATIFVAVSMFTSIEFGFPFPGLK